MKRRLVVERLAVDRSRKPNDDNRPCVRSDHFGDFDDGNGRILARYLESKLDMWHTTTSASAARVWEACLPALGPPDRPVTERLTDLTMEWIRWLRDSDTDRALAAATIDTNQPEARQLFRESTNELYALHIRQIGDDAIAAGDIRAEDGDNFATMAILTLRFLANAPFSSDRDPILGMSELPWSEIETAAVALVE